MPLDCITEVWYEQTEAPKALAGFAVSERGKVILDLEGVFMPASQAAEGPLSETGT